MSAAGPPEMEPVVADVAALPDALLLHALEFLVPSLVDLGRCRCVSTRFAAVAADDQLWSKECMQSFGLNVTRGEAPCAPDGSECPTFYAATRAWSALRCVHHKKIMMTAHR